MARVRIEPGGKVLGGIVILGALFFLFFEIKGGTGTHAPHKNPAPVTRAPQVPLTSTSQPQKSLSTASESQQKPVSSAREESAAPRSEGEQLNKRSPAYGESQPSSQAAPEIPARTTAANVPIKIFFDFNRFAINKNVYCIFDKIVEIVRQQGARNLKIVVEGNADSIGPSWYNVVLSKMRAAHVADSLSRRLRIPFNSIELVANGSSKPAATNETRDGRAENRRTEVLLYY